MNTNNGQANSTPTAFATECDLVMKGGITSGVVYPLAITEIARAFRLRSVGGTSAGAIAAAAAAAAECGRQRAQLGQQLGSAFAPLASGFDPFGMLARLPQTLGERADTAPTTLQAFFRPQRELTHIFRAFLAALGKSILAGLAAATRSLMLHYAWATVLVAAVLGVVIWHLELGSGEHGLVYGVVKGLVWALSSLVAAAVVSLVLAGLSLVRLLPQRHFGLCTGMPAPGDAHPGEPLTAWLSRYLDALSGQTQVNSGQPLTFGDLKAKGVEVNLQMITTCLTHGRPYCLPFRDDDEVKENNQFLYNEQEMRRFFPSQVVDWMVANERPLDDDANESMLASVAQSAGLRRLPTPDNLPVVVATRMSLSFPLLLCAIPLYAVDYNERKVGAARNVKRSAVRCWFTDGGIGSNFPIHFFDAPLPSRPTFGLDLGEGPDHMTDAERIVFPDNNAEALQPFWRHLPTRPGAASVMAFLSGLLDVAKEWNHETLSHMPGYRDRIGLIRLSKSEGGLNLNMQGPQITRLAGYGQQVGREFVTRFGNPALWPDHARPSPMNWDNHQSIRLRLLLATYGEAMLKMQGTLDKVSNTPSNYQRFFYKRTDSGRAYSYPLAGLGKLDNDPATGLPTSQAGLAHQILHGWQSQALLISRTVDAQGKTTKLDHRSPRPKPELRLRPRI